METSTYIKVGMLMELTLEIRKGVKLTTQTLHQENGENKLKETEGRKD